MSRNAATAWACSILAARRRNADAEEQALVYLLTQLYRTVDTFSIAVMGPVDLRAYLTTLKERS